MSWQDNFTNYTTSTAFHMTLTANQVSLLAFISGQEGDVQQTANVAWMWRTLRGRNDFVPVVQGLIRRGLVEHNPMMDEASDVDPTKPSYKDIEWIYRLTPAGECMLQMLRYAKLVADPNAVIAA